jgi:hypothetical protein
MSDRTSNQQLKPCPFCGSLRIELKDNHYVWYVECADCRVSCSVAQRWWPADMSIPVGAWNRRALETAADELALVRDRTANVALTCTGACRYNNGVFIVDPACESHGSPVETSGRVIPRCPECLSNAQRNGYTVHSPECPAEKSPARPCTGCSSTPCVCEEIVDGLVSAALKARAAPTQEWLDRSQGVTGLEYDEHGERLPENGALPEHCAYCGEPHAADHECSSMLLAMKTGRRAGKIDSK